MANLGVTIGWWLVMLVGFLSRRILRLQLPTAWLAQPACLAVAGLSDHPSARRWLPLLGDRWLAIEARASRRSRPEMSGRPRPAPLDLRKLECSPV